MLSYLLTFKDANTFVDPWEKTCYQECDLIMLFLLKNKVTKDVDTFQKLDMK